MRYSHAVAVGLVLLCLGAVASAQAPTRAGEVRAVVPSAELVRGKAAPVLAERRAPVLWQDLVRTNSGGRARIGLDDGSVLNVGSSSELRVVEHDAAAGRTTLELNYGRIRANAVRLARPEQKFEVRTPVASAGVVGTRFIIRTFSEFIEFLCLEGEVRVRNLEPAAPGEQVIRAGQYTRVRRGEAPTPPEAASPEHIRGAEQETDIPFTVPRWEHVEVSWPPDGCGTDFNVAVRAWGQEERDGKVTDVVLDSESVTGTLRLGERTVWVEGGWALVTNPGALPQDVGFTPWATGAVVPTRGWPPLEMTAGQTWRAPRANLSGNAFYVLGPAGRPRSASLRLGEQSAATLWVGPCGGAFLAGAVEPGARPLTLELGGRPVAQGQMNVVRVVPQLPSPQITRGQTAEATVALNGLGGLGQQAGGQPVVFLTVANQTPDIVGNLKTTTPGATVQGNTIVFPIGASHIDANGVAQLQLTLQGRRTGQFLLGIFATVAPPLEKPDAPLAPPSGTAQLPPSSTP